MNHAQRLGFSFLIGVLTVAACSDDEDTTATNGTTTTTTASVGGSGGDGAGGDGAGGDGVGGAGGDGGGATSCYADHSCDPLVPNSCPGAGAACDLGVSDPTGLECFSTGNTAMLGENCGDPVFCVHGLTCPDSVGTCVEFCCDDDDCTTGTCQPHPDLDPALYEAFVCLP
jgi:hypothetical protein